MKAFNNLFKILRNTAKSALIFNFIIYKSFIQKNHCQIKEDKPEYFTEVNSSDLKNYNNLNVLENKSIKVLISLIRNKNTSIREFRTNAHRIISQLLEEAIAGEYTEETISESPLGYYKSLKNPYKETDYVAVSIMRSGNIMIEEVINLMPSISIGKILIQRNEESVEKEASFFFEKLPTDIATKRILLLDPMLATGGSAKEAIRVLLAKGVKEENIIFVNLISCVDGIKNLTKAYPNVKIYTAQVDPYLLPNKYIAPGLGDFGDRYYGTIFNY